MEFEVLFRRAAVRRMPGSVPFPYQLAIASRPEIPQLLHVPTGAGKTAAAVLGWLYRRRLHPDEEVRLATPRRLVYCLPMRCLVEQTVQVAGEWMKALGEAAEGIEVYQLMGGEIDRDWDRFPERDAVLVGTQDQLLSRALNRGYAMSRYRWPIHFALLNSDALWIMDEVQLMGPGLKTTAQLEAFRETFGTAGPVHSLWMSATLRPGDLATVDFVPPADDTDGRVQTLSSEDEAHPVLAQRLQASKPLSPAPIALTKDTRRTYPRELAELVGKAHRPGSLTLAILNQVQRAQETFRALQKASDGEGPELLLLHSRFRAAERRALQERLQQEASANGPGRIVVATQAVEAGVDISARTLFTELSPWSSMVQRFGRCNRKGEWAGEDAAQVHWIDIASEQAQDLQPYEEADLQASRELLSDLTDAGIKAVQRIADPRPVPITQVIRKRDLLDLFDTTPDLAGNDLDVSPYIRETDDLDVQVFWRELGDERPSADEPAPRPDELCTVRLPAFRRFLDKAGKRGVRPSVWDALGREWVRLDEYRLRPGLTVLLDAKAGGYVPELGWWDGSGKPQPVPPVSVEGEGSEAYGSDPYTVAKRFVDLALHTAHVVAEAKALAGALPDISAKEREALLLAARWHDAGKAHPVFQSRLTAGLAEDDPRRATTWAKAPKNLYRQTQERPHFRHELASALAMLQAELPDLAVYLAAAHHGKVRASIRSLPGERPPADQPDARFARGVYEGDVLPAADLGSGVVMPEMLLSLAVMEMGESDLGPSWVSRVLALRDALGPFRLAYIEALLRIADWRGSAEEESNGD